MDARTLKSLVTIEQALSHYGRTLEGKDRGTCLFPQRHHHADDPALGGNPSMYKRADRVFCASQQCFGPKGADVFELVGLMEGISDFAEQRARVMVIGGLTESGDGKAQRRKAATYDYNDEAGRLLFQVVRYEPKDFVQRRPKGNGWIYNLSETRLVLYRLPAVRMASTVLLVEGEKDVDTAFRLGLPDGWAATCNPMGAGKWRAEYSDALQGKQVVILPDADDSGRRHGEFVARALAGKAAGIRTMTLPQGKDLSEWASAGGTPETFQSLLASTVPFHNGNGRPKPEDGHCIEARRLHLTSAASVTPANPRYAYELRIPLGTLTLLAGEPGQGKTLIAMDCAARLSRGTLPGDLNGAPAGTLVLTAEDSLEYTLVPRLLIAEADPPQIQFASMRCDELVMGLNIPDDLEALADAVRTQHARFIILDPFVAYLPERLNSHRDQDVRRALAPLAKFAEAHDVAVLLISHFNKSDTADLLKKIGGSVGLTAAARSVLVVADDPDHDGGHLLVHGKTNMGQFAPTLRYRIEGATVAGADGQPVTSARIVWDGEAAGISSRDLLVSLDAKERQDRRDAVAWLQEFLADGPHYHEEIKAEGEKLGLTGKMLWRAKQKLNIDSCKEGYQGRWSWSLPKDSPKVPKSSHYPKRQSLPKGESLNACKHSLDPSVTTKDSPSVTFEESMSISNSYIESKVKDSLNQDNTRAREARPTHPCPACSGLGYWRSGPSACWLCATCSPPDAGAVLHECMIVPRRRPSC